jgi:hypothetical protein
MRRTRSGSGPEPTRADISLKSEGSRKGRSTRLGPRRDPKTDSTTSVTTTTGCPSRQPVDNAGDGVPDEGSADSPSPTATLAQGPRGTRPGGATQVSATGADVSALDPAPLSAPTGAGTVETSPPLVADRPEGPAVETAKGDAGSHAASSAPPPHDEPPLDFVEAALADALSAATTARRFDVVAQLAKELEARRVARTRNVLSLDVARRRGGREGP